MPVSQNRPTLGFLLASFNTGASRALWPGLVDAAERRDANLISFPGGRLSATTAFESQRNQIFELAGEECLDGLITWASSLGGVLSPREISAFHSRYRSLPMVSLAQFLEGYPSVVLESYQGMRALLTHLIVDHGYRRLALIRGPEEHFFAQERYQAYLDTLQAFNLPLQPELITRPLRWESGTEAVQILLDERGLKPGVDFQALVAVSDMLALWALKTLQARGYEVPGDVAVTGFNNSSEERLATPPLTTVDLPFYEQGALAIDLLLAQLKGETIPALKSLPARLVIRQSCGCPSPAIRLAGYDPDSGATARFDRAACLQEMIMVLSDRSPAAVAACEAVLNGFDSEPASPPADQFIQQFGDTLNQIIPNDPQAIHLWNDVISVLRRRSLDGKPLAARAHLETLFGQARVLVNEAEQRSRAYWEWHSARQNELLNDTNRTLLTTFDIHQLGDVLSQRLPELGIPSAYLVLFEKNARPGGAGRLMMAFDEQGRALIDPAGFPFTTRVLIPDQFLPRRRYTLVVEPLFFQERSLGYIVFEIGPANTDIYELVRSSLSSAIQGALLFDEISQARLIAEKADQIKSRLLANVSHELRTPLNIILGSTQGILTNRPGESTLQGEIRKIHDHAEHQLRVINDLLDLSRAEIDELDLSLEFLDPKPLLENAFRAIASQSVSQQVAWKLDLPERLPIIHADPVRLRQILLNLLSNALKFTENGQVALGAELRPPDLHVWVSDTGWGIPLEQQERIFEPFVTMQHDRRIAGGIGLGLSITRHLVALHGGRMSIHSEPGKGSDFHIYLPLPSLAAEMANPLPGSGVLLFISSGRPSAELLALGRQEGLEIRQPNNAIELDEILQHSQILAVAWDLAASQPLDWNLVRRLRRHPIAGRRPFILYGRLADGDQTAGPGLGLTSFVVKSPNQKSILDALHVLTPSASIGTILIVDDDPAALQAHRSLVMQGLPGASIQQAEDGEAALAFMHGEIPALVLLDLVMPGLSGLDVIDQMRSDPRLRQVPVIVLSNKMLGLEEVQRIEAHARVLLQSKGVWTDAEAISVLNRILFGTDALPAHTSALVKSALAYLQQNYARSLARWEIAAAIGVSEDYLTRLFNRELEISPWEYLNRFRILQAQNLLRTSSLSIGAIAHKVGFKDQAYFSRVFSKISGKSPQGYRDG